MIPLLGGVDSSVLWTKTGWVRLYIFLLM